MHAPSAGAGLDPPVSDIDIGCPESDSLTGTGMPCSTEKQERKQAVEHFETVRNWTNAYLSAWLGTALRLSQCLK